MAEKVRYFFPSFWLSLLCWIHLNFFLHLTWHCFEWFGWGLDAEVDLLALLNSKLLDFLSSTTLFLLLEDCFSDLPLEPGLDLFDGLLLVLTIISLGMLGFASDQRVLFEQAHQLWLDIVTYDGLYICLGVSGSSSLSRIAALAFASSVSTF